MPAPEMNEFSSGTIQRITKPAIVAAAVIFAYWTVIIKLGIDWWTDENYSHGLLIPFVIAFMVWNERATPLPAIVRGGRPVMSSPSSSTWPRLGR